MRPNEKSPETPGRKTGLRALLAPRSIAVLGASSDPGKLNGRVLKYLRDKYCAVDDGKDEPSKEVGFRIPAKNRTEIEPVSEKAYEYSGPA